MILCVILAGSLKNKEHSACTCVKKPRKWTSSLRTVVKTPKEILPRDFRCKNLENRLNHLAASTGCSTVYNSDDFINSCFSCTSTLFSSISVWIYPNNDRGKTFYRMCQFSLNVLRIGSISHNMQVFISEWSTEYLKCNRIFYINNQWKFWYLCTVEYPNFCMVEYLFLKLV